MIIGIDIRNIGKQRTGDEVVFFNLVKNLALIDTVNQYLLFTDLIDNNKVTEIMQRLGVENKLNFKIVNLKSSNKFLWNLWTLPHYLRKNPVDIYHTQYITPFFVPKNVKIITHIHDVSFKAYPEFIKKSDLFFLNILIPRSLKRADKIITVSEFTKQEILKYYKVNPEKIEFVYNALSDDFLKIDYSEKQLLQVRKKYNLPEKFILYLGTLQPRKNIPFLLESFAQASKKLPEFNVVLAGDRSAHNFDRKIDKTIEKYNLADKVIFLGYVPEEEKKLLYQAAHLFVFPSLYEGFGIPILEAMSQGLPVIVSNIPSLKEIAGSAALYFNPHSLAEISEMIYNASINQNIRQKLIFSGLERIKMYSWKKSAGKILSLYSKISH